MSNTIVISNIKMKTTTCIRALANPDQIKGCKVKIKANGKSFEQLSGVLALTGNELRLKILYLMEVEKELCPCDISDILGMSIPAISQHLRKLKDGNVVTTRKAGQTIYYSLKAEHLKILKPFFKYINQNSQTSEKA